jgi:small-conductance mechanosensitive channel
MKRSPGWRIPSLCFAWVLLACLAGALALQPAPGRAQAEEAEHGEKPAHVTLHDQTVFLLRTGAGPLSAEARAREASAALAHAVKANGPVPVFVDMSGTLAVVRAGSTPIVQLSEQDAKLAGDANLEVHASRIASAAREALRREQERAEVANTVFSLSLVVFFGLVTLYLVQKVHGFATRARVYIDEHPHSVPSLHVSSLEVLGPAALRSLLIVSFSVGRWIGTLGLFYAWMLVSLSLFESTRAYTQELTGLLLSPLSELVTRLARTLPVMIIALVAASALLVLVRLVSLFFASVERGETQLSWLAPDLAPATSWLLRVGLVVAALVFAAPLITGDREGALSRIGLIALFSFALATAPTLASVVVGLSVIFSRGLKVKDKAEYGGERGEVLTIGLTAVTMRSEDGSMLVRVPHLRALWHPTRLLTRDRA